MPARLSRITYDRQNPAAKNRKHRSIHNKSAKSGRKRRNKKKKADTTNLRVLNQNDDRSDTVKAKTRKRKREISDDESIDSGSDVVGPITGSFSNTSAPTPSKGASLSIAGELTKGELESRRQALLAANEEEEREIRRLEKLLSLDKYRRRKRKRLLQSNRAAEDIDKTLSTTFPASFDRDGFGYILRAVEGKLDDDESDGEVPPVDKRQAKEDSGDDQDEFDTDSCDVDGEVNVDDSDESSPNDDSEMDDDLDDSIECGATDAEQETEEDIDIVKNHLQDECDVELLETLRKKLRPLINRVSEVNAVSVLTQFRDILAGHPSALVCQVSSRIVTDMFVQKVRIPVKLVADVALFVSIAHDVSGGFLGGQLINDLLLIVDDLLNKNDFSASEDERDASNQQLTNALGLLSQLFVFKVVSASLVFDTMKELMKMISERNLGLIHSMLKSCGSQLRHDASDLLKEFVTTLSDVKVDDQVLRSSRVTFLLDDLKDSAKKKFTEADDTERNKRMAKVQRHLLQTFVTAAGRGRDGSTISQSYEFIVGCARVYANAGSVPASAPEAVKSNLRMRNGAKWWLVAGTESGFTGMTKAARNESKGETTNDKFMAIARKLRMNTDIRKNICCAIAAAQSGGVEEAVGNVARLNLKQGPQQREPIFVAFEMCAGEKRFNSFYAEFIEAYVGRDRKLKLACQYHLWDKVNVMGEMKSKTAVANVAHLTSALLIRHIVTINALKTVEFSKLNPHLTTFLKIVLTSVFELIPMERNELLSPLFDHRATLTRECLTLFCKTFLLKDATPAVASAFDNFEQQCGEL